MKWRVLKANNPDVEREHLNKILAELTAEVEALKSGGAATQGPQGLPGTPGTPGAAGAAGAAGADGTRVNGFRTISGTTDTPTAADAGYVLYCTNAAGCSITINDGVFSANDILYANATAGQITFVEGGSQIITTPETLLSEKANATVALIFRTSSRAIMVGQMEPV